MQPLCIEAGWRMWLRLCHQTLSSTSLAHNSWTIQNVTAGGKISRLFPRASFSPNGATEILLLFPRTHRSNGQSPCEFMAVNLQVLLLCLLEKLLCDHCVSLSQMERDSTPRTSSRVRTSCLSSHLSPESGWFNSDRAVNMLICVLVAVGSVRTVLHSSQVAVCGTAASGLSLHVVPCRKTKLGLHP